MSSLGVAQSPRVLPHDAIARSLAAVCLAVALSYAVFLAGSFAQGYFLLDQQGHGIANDFVNLWSAGRLLIEGKPDAPYDSELLARTQASAVGHAVTGYPTWPYPPQFLFVAAAIATMPYAPALVVWLTATAAAYVLAIRNILGPVGALFACAFPGALWNVTAGQTGFLSAALIGGALGLLQRHPIIAGICIGLQAYKPQLGMLFPLALAFGGFWRAFFAAAATALASVLLSWIILGGGAWQAFVHTLSTVNTVTLIDGATGWNKLQTVFALARSLGGSDTLALIAQSAVTVAVTVVLCAYWRSRAPFELKAAALVVGALLATPYLFIYDLVVLAVPTAFLLRFAMPRGLLRNELILLPAAGALLLSYIVATTQVGLAATLIVGFLIVQRALLTSPTEQLP
jgi:arabinofuranan 3-O-arabinosyltransferase